MTALSALLYFVSLQFYIFLRNPTATKVHILTETPMDFPAVTICNFNMIRKSLVPESSIMEYVIRSLFPSGYGYEPPDFSNSTKLALANKMNMTELVYNSAPKFEDMFLACYWISREINCSEYFTPTITPMGLGFTFNSEEFIRTNGSMKVYRTGSEQGLHIRLNVEQDDYFYGMSASAGFKVIV